MYVTTDTHSTPDYWNRIKMNSGLSGAIQGASIKVESFGNVSEGLVGGDCTDFSFV